MGDTLTRYGEKIGVDYILIDVGPSSGALTRSCFLACDAFLIPMNADRFNVQAIHTLSEVLHRWITEHAAIYSDFKKLGLPVKDAPLEELILEYSFDGVNYTKAIETEAKAGRWVGVKSGMFACHDSSKKTEAGYVTVDYVEYK